MRTFARAQINVYVFTTSEKLATPRAACRLESTFYTCGICDTVLASCGVCPGHATGDLAGRLLSLAEARGYAGPDICPLSLPPGWR